MKIYVKKFILFMSKLTALSKRKMTKDKRKEKTHTISEPQIDRFQMQTAGFMGPFL